MQAWTAIDATDHAVRPILRLAGEGDLRGPLEKWRTGLRHPEDVELLGYTEDVEQFYRSLYLLAMPSHAEGFGLAAAEALSCAVPVIASNVSSLPEIVIDGETGLLVPPRDSEALSEALTRLLNDPDLARRLGHAGREFVLEHYPREKILARFLGLTGHPDFDPEGNPR